ARSILCWRKMKSLKLKFAMAISLLVVTVLLVNATATVLTRRRQLKAEITANVNSFAGLTAPQIGQSFEMHFSSGYYKFRGLITGLLKINQHLESIQIIDMDGLVLFDSRNLEAPSGKGNIPVADSQVVQRAKWMEPSQRIIRLAEGSEGRDIIVPYFDEWGRHSISVRYLASYKSLGQLVYATLVQILIMTVVFVALGVVLAYLTARAITDPITSLTLTIRQVGQGNIGQQVESNSNDELGELAKDFNQMSQQLKENMEALSDSYEKLYQANLSLRELDNLKSQFIANVSHELKSPLTSIVGYTEYLLDGKMGPISQAQQKGLEVIRRNLKKLTHQIVELVDITSIEAGHLALNETVFEIKPLLEEAASNYRAEAYTKKLKILASSPGNLMIRGDRDRILQVMDNLVENALKFSRAGSITLSAEVISKKVRISVSDTGAGIPAEFLPRIFERFYQVDGSSSRKYGGVGLGLSIVKAIVEAHGSQIEVSSRLGGGTTFSFELPVPVE
ncbi:MAG: HAMP domain-containing sensor histidine kinase, partial [bacterium]|nr:HAMP domain-containing sensor histidine kinase [bacterium]